jgi:hypothetical protein
MRYVLPLVLFTGLAGCVDYHDGYAYRTQYQPGNAYNYSGTYSSGYLGGYSSYGTCDSSPFVWGTCAESPVD